MPYFLMLDAVAFVAAFVVVALGATLWRKEPPSFSSTLLIGAWIGIALLLEDSLVLTGFPRFERVALACVGGVLGRCAAGYANKLRDCATKTKKTPQTTE